MSDRSTLRIRSLTIDRMYGMRMGLAVDEISDGLNVVYGPNAAGKTTIVRAVEALLWEESPYGDTAIIDAELSINGTRWTVSRQGPVVQWQREGIAHDPPRLPPPDQRDRYRLLLPELLDKEGRALADVVKLEAVGGIDIERSKSELKFSRSSPQRKGIVKEAETKSARFREILDEQKVLSRKRTSLRDLQRELESLQESKERQVYLQRLIEWLQDSERLTKAGAHLDGFPEGMDLLRGDELDVLEQLQTRRDEARRDLEEAGREAADARRILAENSLPDGGLDDGVLERLSRCVRSVEDHARNVEDARTAHQAARSRADELFLDIAPVVEPDGARSVDIGDIGDIASWAREAEKVRNWRIAAEELLAFLDVDDSADHYEVLTEAASALRRWAVLHGQGSSGADRTVRVVLAVSAILTLLVAVVVGVLFNPIALLFISAALVQVWILWKMDRSAVSGDPERYRREYEATGVRAPDAWTDESVEVRLRELHRELADARWSQMREVKREEIKQKLADADRSDQLDRLRDRLAEQTGIRADAADEEVVYLVQRIETWRDAEADVRAAEEKMLSLSDRLSERMSEVPDIMENMDIESPDTVSDAQDLLYSLQSASTEYAEASAHLSRAEQRMSTSETAVDQAEEEIEAVYRRSGMETGEVNLLRRRLDRLDAYREVLKEHQHLQGVVDAGLNRLRQNEHFDESDAEASLEEIHRRSEEAAHDTERYDEVAREITEIRTLVREAEAGRRLEAARADLDSALDDVREYRMSTLRSHAGSLVAEYVESLTRDQQLPDVMMLAREKFARIAPRYKLDWDWTSGNFAAQDRVRKTRMSLDSLSAGTRVQLLLSVRLAFIEQQEQGHRLPIILDETLANSDDEKAQQIMHAILEICRGGRQVFYCTAQTDEVDKWKQTIDRDGELASSFHAVREAPQPGERPVAHFTPEGRHIEIERRPGPEGDTHEQYGRRLGIPPWTPWDPLESAHAWFIVDDPDVLHRLVSARLEFWGPARDVVVQGGAKALGLSSENIDRVLVLGAAASTWHEAWKEGRGRPVDAIAIAECPAVSETFRGRVVALSNRLDGDGRLLVERLMEGDVKRFHTTKADELKEWLIDRGYIDTGEPLTEEQIWSRMLRGATEGMTKAGVTVEDLDRLRRRLTPSRIAEPSEG